MELPFAGRVAVITGAAQGIGKAIAERLGRAGCALTLVDLNPTVLMATVDDMKSHGIKAHGFVGDVSKSTDVNRVIEEIIARESRIDFLVNNAGVSYKREGKKIPIVEIPEEQWDHVFGVNLKGAFLCSQAAARHMIRQRFGRIVNMCSMAGKLGNSGPAGAHYSASKAGLICLTKSLALELAPYGIRANGVAPGVIRTEMLASSSEEVNRRFLERIPMNRFGTPEEVADAVHFLVSEASTYITGEILDVNGGILMD
jgi:3-oxoacyl-[acyl-carrier protein] reductase